jgi:hypothetical protein
MEKDASSGFFDYAPVNHARENCLAALRSE